jgi:hypothetical protein
MAATEVIHFPLCVQLDHWATILAHAFRGFTASPPGSPPILFDDLQARPNGISFSFPTGGLSV